MKRREGVSHFRKIRLHFERANFEPRTMLTTASRLHQLRDSTLDIRRKIEGHALYREIQSVADLRWFMQLHVFAVWDFMSLLKALQNSLTSISVPWVPSPYPTSCRLINEIVLGEESDTYKDGHCSHFEIYLEAMREAGADTGPIRRLVAELRAGSQFAEALAAADVPDEAQTFVRSTFALIDAGKPHITAAAFTFGREDLIPAMFLKIVRDLRLGFAGLAEFEYYLERHIEVDGDSHGPMALRMLEDLCGEDERRWTEASQAARNALQARLKLWDAINARILLSRSR
jgi:hypothetical protein